MTFCFARVRHALAIAIGAGSILAGLVLAFGLVTPGVVQQLPTNELLGLLGLLILPLLTFWAFVVDRRAAANAPVAIVQPATAETVRTTDESEALALAFHSEPEAEIETIASVEVHAPGRRTVRHRRHEPMHASRMAG